MIKFVVLVAALAVAMLANIEVVHEPKGHGLVPSFARITGANYVNPCEFMESVYKVDKRLSCEVRATVEKPKYKVYKLDQRFEGVRIWNTNGMVISENASDIINGNIYLVPPKKGNPVLTEEQALQIAKKALEGKMSSNASEEISAETMDHDSAKTDLVYAANVDEMDVHHLRLSYLFDIMIPEIFHHSVILIDAENGSVINVSDHTYTGDVSGQTDTGYYGIQNITVSDAQVGYLAAQTGERKLSIKNCVNSEGVCIQFNYGIPVTSPTRDGFGTNGDDLGIPDLDKLMSIYYSVEEVWKFNKERFGQDSWDGRGTEIRSFGLQGKVNAFWTTYGGVGYAMYDFVTGVDLGSVDVVGHELTHGTIDGKNGLIYQNESGALNEGYADIFGIYLYQNIRNDPYEWTIGTQTTIVRRNISNPKQYNYPDTYKGRNWYSGTADNGGVHTNSQVIAYIFYLLAEGGTGINDNGDAYEVYGIGIDEAADIFYDSLDLMPNDTTYAQCRTYVLEACTAIYNSSTAAECQQVKNAFHAGGVGAKASEARVE